MRRGRNGGDNDEMDSEGKAKIFGAGDIGPCHVHPGLHRAHWRGHISEAPSSQSDKLGAYGCMRCGGKYRLGELHIEWIR